MDSLSKISPFSGQVLVELGADKFATPHGGKFMGMTPADIAKQFGKADCVTVLEGVESEVGFPLVQIRSAA